MTLEAYPSFARVVSACFLAITSVFTSPSPANPLALPILYADSPDLQAYRDAVPIVDWSREELEKRIPEIRGFEPVTSQSDLPVILRKTGANVEDFLRGFVSTASVEEIHQERSGINGSAIFNSIKLNYLLLASAGANGRELREYRSDSKGKPAIPRSRSGKFILTTGFAAQSIYFAPKFQGNSRFRLLGKDRLNSRPMLLVAFAQLPDPKTSLGGFASESGSVPVLVQGVAWIDPNHFHIARLRTDLLAPQHGVNLDRLTTDITYRPVRFKGSPLEMWLPHEVNVTVIYQDTTFRNQHLYSEYKLFNVESGAKPGTRPSGRSDQ